MAEFPQQQYLDKYFRGNFRFLYNAGTIGHNLLPCDTNLYRQRMRSSNLSVGYRNGCPRPVDYGFRFDNHLQWWNRRCQLK